MFCILGRKEKKTKPYRPCVYCGLKQSKLTRHLKTKHINEDRIRTALLLPRQLQQQEFDQIKKEGIFEANKNIMKNSKLSSQEVKDQLMRERKQGKSDTVVCSLCNGFFAAIPYIYINAIVLEQKQPLWHLLQYRLVSLQIQEM